MISGDPSRHGTGLGIMIRKTAPEQIKESMSVTLKLHGIRNYGSLMGFCSDLMCHLRGFCSDLWEFKLKSHVCDFDIV